MLKKILRTVIPSGIWEYSKRFKRILINPDKYHILSKADLTYSTDQLYTHNNCDFRKDPRFAESYALARKVDEGQLLSKNDIPWRMHVLFWAGTVAKTKPGDFVDCGVNTGFCARALMNYIGFEKLNKKYFLFDTFAGLDPKYSSPDELRINVNLGYDRQKNNFEKVKKTFAGFNVEIIKGTVPDSLSRAKINSVCFLHLDMNTAKPEVMALDYFWGKISSGGVVLFDDYGFRGHEAQKNSHDQWAKAHGVEILTLPTGQGLLIKP